MEFPSPIHIRYECRRQLGWVLSLIRLHRLEYQSIDGVQIVRKKRRLHAYWLIPLGNLFLKFSNIPVVALSTKDWIEWERAIDRATRQDRIFPASSDQNVGDRDLISRKLPGSSLSDLLANPCYSFQQKMQAIQLSLTALQTLHRCQADWGNGVHQSISHGDATSRNVIVDLDRAAACWIDFDTRHQPELPEWDRQTEDLLTLVFSSAVELPESTFPDLADLIRSGLSENAVIEHFCERVTANRGELNTFQLAQAPLQRPKVISLLTAIQKAFKRLP